MWISLVLMAGLAAPAEGVQFADAAWKEILADASKAKKLVFVDFYTDW